MPGGLPHPSTAPLPPHRPTALLPQVYESVSKSGQLSEAELALFDEPETEQLLYELRFLSVQQRVPAAAYVAAEQLSQSECVVLARAIKEHERRKGTKEGFADTPADALAYKHFRDALECRREADVEACVRQGLAVAQTDSARAKLSALVGEAAAPISALPTATLTVLRLTRDELGFRPVAAAGSLQDVTAAAVRAAPKVSAEGVFGNFRVPQEGVQHEWVVSAGAAWVAPESRSRRRGKRLRDLLPCCWCSAACTARGAAHPASKHSADCQPTTFSLPCFALLQGLPNWSIVARAVNPVALTIENCAAVPEIATAVAAKTEDARKRLGGVGLLVVDTAAEGSSSGPDPSQFYLLSASGGGVRLATGAVAAEEPAALLGPVLFLCRPPARDGAASQTAELLSV